uniref:Carboxypeptidase n=1 Tax=Cyclophora tenuis TaxID=216820 RepID=A0A7S1D1P9_CYCTE|mmetsp:Transcript_18988/g.32520  ORF Transcript_18988/g.32520 Transcript_18988/m.32520 type:complete len:195 (+) Transcript_18988:692-1276(+)
MSEYLNISAVKDALHVTGMFFITDDAAGFDYTMTEKTVEPFYQSINGKLKVLVYNGDADPRINSFDAQNWTSHLGFPKLEDWTPWTIDGCRRMGGYVVRYDGMFDFLTIRGAGHMVPTYKPEATFAFLKAWIDGTDYPPYVASCNAPPPPSSSSYSNTKKHTNKATTTTMTTPRLDDANANAAFSKLRNKRAEQ